MVFSSATLRYAMPLVFLLRVTKFLCIVNSPKLGTVGLYCSLKLSINAFYLYSKYLFLGAVHVVLVFHLI